MDIEFVLVIIKNQEKVLFAEKGTTVWKLYMKASSLLKLLLLSGSTNFT